jgi:hypothetical protein
MIYISQIEMPKSTQVELISRFKNNLVDSQIWAETRLLRLNDGLSQNTDCVLYDMVINICKQIKNFVKYDNRFDYIENIEIVKYPKGSSKTFHFDKSVDDRTAASITYINDDYIGGQTTVEGVSVQPLAGRTVYFGGKEFKHNVMNVIKGSRYTVSVWYTSNLNENFLKEIS